MAHDRADKPAPASTVVGVHARVTLDAVGDVDVERVAYCPTRMHTVGISVCETCPRFGRLDHDAEGPVVMCSPDPTPDAKERERLLQRFDLGELTMRIRVGEVMTRVVTCVKPETSIAAVRTVLAENGASCAPVVNDEGALLGIVTPSELLFTNDALIASQVMARSALGIPEDAPLAHAMATMAQAGVLALPVLAGDGAVVGAIGALEALRFFARRWGYEIPAPGSDAPDPSALTGSTDDATP